MWNIKKTLPREPATEYTASIFNGFSAEKVYHVRIANGCSHRHIRAHDWRIGDFYIEQVFPSNINTFNKFFSALFCCSIFRSFVHFDILVSLSFFFTCFFFSFVFIFQPVQNLLWSRDVKQCTRNERKKTQNCRDRWRRFSTSHTRSDRSVSVNGNVKIRK